MEIGLTIGACIASAILGFLAACIFKAAEDAEPHAIPRGEDLWRHTATMPPRRTPTAGTMNDPFDAQSWDSD